MCSLRNPFRYTKNNSRLTPRQRAFYEEHGYIVFPKLVPQDLLDRCNERFEDIITGKVSGNAITVMYDVKDRKSVNKVQDIHNDEVFLEYIKCKEILDIVEAFTGANILAIHNMLIAKPPDIGFGTTKHPPHQDLYYFPIRPADTIVAAWTAMEPCNNENGCLYVYPGSHRFGKLFAHDYPPGAEPGTVNKFYHGILDMPYTVKSMDLEMQPGDTVFFHPLLIHGSGVNRSQGNRRAISCHYSSCDGQYIDVDKSVQSTIKDEVMQYVRSKTGMDLDYADVWRFKSILVRGIRSNL